MKAAAPPPAPAWSSVAERFRLQIEQALADGAPLDDLTLCLTRGDAEQLKRDRKTPLEAISFADGAMRYLGVKVAVGEVPASVLRRPEADAGADPGANSGAASA